MMLSESPADVRNDLRCHFFWFRVLELAVMQDNVHLFASARPAIPPAKLIQPIKSITVRKVSERFSGIIQIFWGDTFWERGYFVIYFACSVVIHSAKIRPLLL